MNMEIRNYIPGDEYKIVELFKLVFNQEMSLNQWKWRFEMNPAGKHMIKLMWEDDLLVGHYAVSPIIMSVNGKDELTAHSLTTMTHPEYNGKGIFKTLSLNLYDELENKHGCKSVWGFPNNNSHGAFINTLGWEDISVVHTLGISADKIKSNSIDLIDFEEFEQHHADYILQKLDAFPIKVKRDVSYLNWRYKLKPAVVYKKFFLDIEGQKALFVTKIYPSSKTQKYDLNIVECFMDDYSMIHSCIYKIMQVYNLDFDRITLWKNLFDKDHSKLERQGFVPMLPQTYLGARIHNSMPSNFSNYKDWFITMGDSDVF